MRQDEPLRSPSVVHRPPRQMSPRRPQFARCHHQRDITRCCNYSLQLNARRTASQLHESQAHELHMNRNLCVDNFSMILTFFAPQAQLLENATFSMAQRIMLPHILSVLSVRAIRSDKLVVYTLSSFYRLHTFYRLYTIYRSHSRSIVY